MCTSECARVKSGKTLPLLYTAGLLVYYSYFVLPSNAPWVSLPIRKSSTFGDFIASVELSHCVGYVLSYTHSSTGFGIPGVALTLLPARMFSM